MQTFLPYADFQNSAVCLDRQRLGKQRVESLQLLRALTNPGSGWSNHPAAKMWRGSEPALVEYGLAICREWMRRGYQDSCYTKILSVDAFPPDWENWKPSWLGDPAFHASHRSNLLRKDPVWYGQFRWTEPNNLPYVWPVNTRSQLESSDA